MANLRIIDGIPAPDSDGERIRRRLRKLRVRDDPQCPRCAGREWVHASIGNVKNKLCIACLMKGERCIME